MEEKKTKLKMFLAKKSNRIILIVGISFLVLLIAVIVILGVLHSKKVAMERRNAEIIHERKAMENLLKEKDEIFRKITISQAYCGDIVDDNIKLDDEYLENDAIKYWSLSKNFQNYNQLQEFILKNVTNNLFQKISFTGYYRTFDKSMYLEKDNKLYCGHVDMKIASPKTTNYMISKYDNNTIDGYIIDIYDKETVKNGIVSKQKYQSKIVLVKENNQWKIDSYESALINEINTSSRDNDLYYDKKTYEIGDLYFDDLKKNVVNSVKTTSVKYNDLDNMNALITIDNGSVYLKYDKDGARQQKKININGEQAKSIMYISINVTRYVYILTQNGNVYLNFTQLLSSNVDDFVNFSKINNLANVSEMFLDYTTPYFIINNQLYTSHGELAYHNIKIGYDVQSDTEGIYYYMLVGNDGLLYKKTIEEKYAVGSPEATDSILTHQKQGNELFKDENNENVVVSILYGINDGVYLIDQKGNYYKVELLDNKEIKLNVASSKKVRSIDKYSKSSVVKKIEINYADGTKDTYLSDTDKLLW